MRSNWWRPSRQPALWVAVIAVLWILPGLIGHDPWKPDEAYTFGLVYHILSTGDWVVPALAQEPFLEKPPAYFLTAAGLATMFGGLLPVHDAARLASGFYVGLAFLLTGLAGRELYGAGKGWVAALLLIGSVGLVVQGHQLMTDTGQLTGFALAVYGLSLVPRTPLAAGAALGCGAGLAFLTKGLLGPGCLGLVALMLPVLHPPWRTRRYAGVLCVAGVVALPWVLIWPLALYQRSPALFSEWFWDINVGWFIGRNPGAPKPSVFYYVYTLPWFALPSWPLAALTLARGWRGLRKRIDLALPAVFLAVVFVVLSASSTGRELYAMPMLIGFALLAAPAAAGAGSLIGKRAGAVLLACLGLVALQPWMAWAVLDLGLWRAGQQALLSRQPGYAPAFSPALALAAAVHAGAALYAMTRLWGRPERLTVAWAVAVTLTWGSALILLERYIDARKTYRAVFAELVRQLPVGYGCIASINLGEPQRALLQYFSGIVTFRQESPGRARPCDLLLIQGFRDRIRSPDSTWDLVWSGARPGDTRELFQLYRRSPGTAAGGAGT